MKALLKIKMLFMFVCIAGLNLYSDTIDFVPKDSVLEENAHKIQPRQTVIKGNPLAILWGPVMYTAEYRMMEEIAVGFHESYQFGVSFLGESPVLGLVALQTPPTQQKLNFSVYGYRVQGAYKYYYMKRHNAPCGLYVGPLISYATATVKESSTGLNMKETNFNLNLISGWQVVAKKGLAFDVCIGFGYRNEYARNYSPPNTYDPADFVLRPSHFNILLSVNIGFGF